MQLILDLPSLESCYNYIILQRECCLLKYLGGAPILIHLPVDCFSQVPTSRESTFPKYRKVLLQLEVVLGGEVEDIRAYEMSHLVKFQNFDS